MSTCGRTEGGLGTQQPLGCEPGEEGGSGVRELWLQEAVSQRLSLPLLLPTLQQLRFQPRAISIFFSMTIIVLDTLKFTKAPVLNRGSHPSNTLESNQSNLLSLPKFVSRLLWPGVGLVAPQVSLPICLLVSFVLRSEED